MNAATAGGAAAPGRREEPPAGDLLLGALRAEYDLGADPHASLLEVSENATYRIDDRASGRRWALRLHRPGYHTREEILAELAWVASLRAEAVVNTAPVAPTRSGDLVAAVAAGPGGGRRHAVLFEWVDGVSPEPSDTAGLLGAFATLGEITARLHRHARAWHRPARFTRFAWTWHTTLGAAGRWGRWVDGMPAAPAPPAAGGGTAAPPQAPGAGAPAGADGLAVLSRAGTEIERRLAEYGTGAGRFGLVHADLRLANLLVARGAGGPPPVYVIDFDDCGFGWFMYDLAASLSFIEHLPVVGELVEAWLAGYRRLAPVTAADEAMLPTFVMLRRMLLVAWLGTHPHSRAVAEVAGYAAGSAALADDYLCGRLLGGRGRRVGPGGWY